MLKPARLLIILFVLTFAVYVHADNVITGKVVGVSDGDTITILENRTQYKIRLYGLDCPERRQDFGTRAKQFVSDLVFGNRSGWSNRMSIATVALSESYTWGMLRE